MTREHIEVTARVVQPICSVDRMATDQVAPAGEPQPKTPLMKMEDLPKHAVQDVFMAFDSAHGSEADITIRPHQHRTLPSDFPLLGPRAPCIDIVAFKYAEANGDQVDAIAFYKFVGRIDPGLTVFSGD